jgi:hypothetical protein
MRRCGCSSGAHRPLVARPSVDRNHPRMHPSSSNGSTQMICPQPVRCHKTSTDSACTCNTKATSLGSGSTVAPRCECIETGFSQARTDVPNLHSGSTRSLPHMSLHPSFPCMRRFHIDGPSTFGFLSFKSTSMMQGPESHKVCRPL